jgi:hypothetical protein
MMSSANASQSDSDSDSASDDVLQVELSCGPSLSTQEILYYFVLPARDHGHRMFQGSDSRMGRNVEQ